MSSSQHIQEVSRRARWSHLANERSISTSKGPPPAPAKALFDIHLTRGAFFLGSSETCQTIPWLHRLDAVARNRHHTSLPRTLVSHTRPRISRSAQLTP
ncbi:hypothetical protein FJTKL_08908 [Diaporthe vaccinii]|uniref:Uncharacterized protein n=1 Tax=Diaporthe vaccinii TaxID=105482 RepID=A0ABR4EQ25_9PEZI